MAAKGSSPKPAFPQCILSYLKNKQVFKVSFLLVGRLNRCGIFWASSNPRKRWCRVYRSTCGFFKDLLYESKPYRRATVSTHVSPCVTAVSCGVHLLKFQELYCTRADHSFNVSLSAPEESICQALICMCYSVGLHSWAICFYSDDL